MVEPAEDAESSDVPTMSYDFAKIRGVSGKYKSTFKLERKK